MGAIGLSAAPLDIDALMRSVQLPEHGAVATFLGTTRETSPGDPRPVAALEYEAYEAMAVAEMEAIADEARERFGPLQIAIVHRTGRVALTEPSIAIVVAWFALGDQALGRNDLIVGLFVTAVALLAGWRAGKGR